MKRILSALLITIAAVVSLRATTTFYVDPDWTGSQSGAAGSPWSSFSSSAWSSINSALNNDDVTVYASALKANGTQQSRAWFIEFQRTVASSHRLTVDGYSYWNANTSTPSWQANGQDISLAYKNGRVFKLTGNGSSALGWTRYSTYKKQDNITVRGFEVTGSSARTSFAGDNLIWEYINIHDITTDAPALGILYTFMDNATTISERLFPACTNMTVRNARIDTCYGEAFYIGAVDPDIPVSVQQAIGNQHSGITISNVFIRNPGTGGGQGDGIDTKNGVTDFHISDCEIVGVEGMAGIILPQSMSDVDQKIVVERCFIHDCNSSGEERYGIYAISSDNKFGYKGITVRNCVIARMTRGIAADGSATALANLNVLNNTIYGCSATGLSVSQADSATILNNIITHNATSASISGSSLVQDYNAYAGGTPSGEGSHTMTLSSAQDTGLLVNPAANNFLPQPGSAIIARAQTLGSFTDDLNKVTRGSLWDVGACQYAQTSTGGTPTVSVTASDANASEANRDPGVFTITRTGSTSAALTVNYTLSGTAGNGTDYNTLPGSVTIGTGAASVAVTVTPIDDTLVEGSETVTLTLSANAAYTAGSPASATVSIADNDSSTGADTTQPTVSMSTPLNNASVSGTAVSISASASDNVGVVGVQFMLDGNNLGAEDTGTSYSMMWNTTTTANGSHALTAVARDAANNKRTSAAMTVVVSNSGSTTSSDVVWVQDAVPAGGQIWSNGDSWTWVSSNPSPFSGATAHQSTIAAGYHNHYFLGATATLTVATGDKLFGYVYLDPSNRPTEVMLHWNDGTWEHRAYWGANNIQTYATPGTAGLYYAGPLPAAGQWARLEVPASAVGLEGRTLNGMAFSVYDGRATWDYAGKSIQSGSTTLPTVTVTATDPNAAEAKRDPGVFTVARGGSTSASLTVNYSVGGSAVNGTDYNTIPAAVTIPAGAASTTVTVTPIDDKLVEGSETVRLTLSANAAYVVGSPASATVSIADDDSSTVADTIAPTISLSAPATVSGTAVTVSASASDNVGVVGVQFKLDGANLGAEDTSAPYSVSWNTTGAANGSHTLTAIARDAAGNLTTAAATVLVSNGATSVVWVQDALPAGAQSGADFGDAWTWVSNNPTAYSGTLAHQSAVATQLHDHYFYGATATLGVNTGDHLFAYIYLDPSNPPSEVMLEWYDGSWEHRAYWGANNINTADYGVNGTVSRYYAGALPAAGQWVRLDVPASAVGLQGSTLNGMAFNLYGGRATWDATGKTSP